MPASKVTIGITCYNAADTIERAIRSAFAQDWPELEIIIVDDASTDRSVEAIESLIAHNKRARLVVHETNRGVASARNTILSAASGEFVAFFDDDDESHPARIRTQANTLREYESATGEKLIACYASGERRYDSGYVKPIRAIGSQPVVPHGPALAERLLVYKNRPGWFYGAGTPACSIFARRDTFEAVAGFDESLRRVEDVDLAIRLALKGGHFVGTKEPVFVQYSTSTPDKSPEANRDSEIALALKHRIFLESIGRYDYAIRWPKLRYWHFKKKYHRFAFEFIGLLVRHPIAVARHLLETGPRRLQHERKIRTGKRG